MTTQPSSKVTNLGKIGEAHLDLIPQVEDCNPGIEPTEYNVLIAPARAAKTIGKLGILIAADEIRDTNEMAMQVGRIVAASPLAFNYDSGWPDPSQKPKVGDLVWYARYAGALIEEAFDGQMYRMVKDKDVSAILRPPVSEKVQEAA